MPHVRFIEYEWARRTIHSDHIADGSKPYIVPHAMIIDGSAYVAGPMEIIDENIDPTLVVHLHRLNADGSLGEA